MGRLIHPEPLISELRKRMRTKTRLLAVQRIGDFAESVAATLRDINVWADGVASIVVSRTLSMFIPP